MTTEQELTKQKIEATEKKLVADKARMAKIVAETFKLNKEIEETKAELEKLQKEVKQSKEKADENNLSMERVEREYDEFQNQILELEKILKITN